MEWEPPCFRQPPPSDRFPTDYFQAVGSGTGAIAAWEANLRLLADGRYGNRKMKLMVSQNIPFIPIHDAWKAGSRAMLPLDDNLARRQVEEIDAKVLSNRKPPYPIFGGLYDAMNDAGGDILLATVSRHGQQQNFSLKQKETIFTLLRQWQQQL